MSTTDDERKEARLAGERFGLELIPVIKMMEPPDQSQRVIWWGALLASLGGTCLASIGPEAAGVLRDAIPPMLDVAFNEKAH